METAPVEQVRISFFLVMLPNLAPYVWNDFETQHQQFLHIFSEVGGSNDVRADPEDGLMKRTSSHEALHCRVRALTALLEPLVRTSDVPDEPLELRRRWRQNEQASTCGKAVAWKNCVRYASSKMMPIRLLTKDGPPRSLPR